MKYLKLFEQDFDDDPFGEEVEYSSTIELKDIIDICEHNNITYWCGNGWASLKFGYGIDEDVMIMLPVNMTYYIYFKSDRIRNIFYDLFFEKYPTSIIRKHIMDNNYLTTIRKKNNI